MQIILRASNLPLTDRDRAYIEEKVMKLQHFAHRAGDEAAKIHIDVEQRDIKTTNRKLHIQGTFHVPPHAFLRAESLGTTIQEATDLFVEKLERQIDRFKEKSSHFREKRRKKEMP